MGDALRDGGSGSSRPWGCVLKTCGQYQSSYNFTDDRWCCRMHTYFHKSYENTIIMASENQVRVRFHASSSGGLSPPPLISTEFRSTFHRNLFLTVRLKISQHWLRLCSVVEKVARPYLKQWCLIWWRAYAPLKGLKRVEELQRNRSFDNVTNDENMFTKGNML